MLDNVVMQAQQKPQYKFVIFLAMIYLIGWTTTYPMIYKMVEIHHILEPGAIFLFPLSYAIADIIAEVYGYRIARQIVWFALSTGFIFCISLRIVATLPAPEFWHKQENYDVVFSPMLRAYFATTIASLFGSFVNIYAISKFKILMYGKYFWLRSLLSTGIGEFIFSVIGGTLAYAGVMPIAKIPFLMLDGYLFKMLYAFIAVWPVVLIAAMLKKSEKVEIYDYGISYNPFKISID